MAERPILFSGSMICALDMGELSCRLNGVDLKKSSCCRWRFTMTTESNMTIDDKSLSELIELGEKATVKLQLVEIGDCYYVQTDQGEKMMLYWPTHEQGSEPEAAAVELTARRGEFLEAAANLAIPLALEVRRLREQKDGAYKERDALVCALSKLFPSWLARHPDSDTSWDKDWRWIVFVQLPTGQASWHIHDSERSMFDHLAVGENCWDGHNNERKYERLAALEALRDQ